MERNTQARACDRCEWFDSSARPLRLVRNTDAGADPYRWTPDPSAHGVCRIPAANGSFPPRKQTDWCWNFEARAETERPIPKAYQVGIDSGEAG